MDIDFLRSISEDQTDMMMMQLDKLPDFAGVFKDHPSTDTFMDQPTTNLNNNINNIPNYSLDQDLNFINPSDTLSFTSQPQTPRGHHEMQFLSTSRWRNASGDRGDVDRKRNSMAAMREMIFRMAAMQPIHIDPESIKPPKRRNVKISKDPQSVAARHRRERISERIRILQRLVPGGTKMDTASMLDEAIHYLKFLKNQVQTLEKVGENRPPGIGFPVPMSSGSYIPIGASAKGYQQPEQNFHHQISL